MIKTSFEEIKNKLSFIRLTELNENPIKGSFNLEHLKQINAYIFQDSLDLENKNSLKLFRDEISLDSNELWHKQRYYTGFGNITVFYSPMDCSSIKEAENILNSINLEHLKKLQKTDFAKEITNIYRKIDYFHPFPDGNSRTLREFARTLAQEVGFKLEWSKISKTELYLARDFEVNSIALSKTTNPLHKTIIKNEMEAIYYHKEYKPLEKVINTSLSKNINKKQNKIKKNHFKKF